MILAAQHRLQLRIVQNERPLPGRGASALPEVSDSKQRQLIPDSYSA